MNLYSKKQRWKVVLSIVGMLLIGVFLWYSNSVTERLKEEQINHVKKWSQTVKKKADLVNLTNQTFEQLREEELKKVKLRAAATKEIEKDLPDYSFSLYIISEINTIPIILTDANDNYIQSINVNLEQTDSIAHVLQKWEEENEPISIQIDKNLYQKLYFRNSDKYYQLERMRDSLIEGFSRDLTENKAVVPFVFVDSASLSIYATNVEELNGKDSLEKGDITALFKDNNPPINIQLDDQQRGFIYYANSPLIKTLEVLPYLQLSAILVFFFIAYFLFSTFRKAEQNQVWVGMAKETAHQLGTPISSLMAWVELLKSQGIDASTTDEMTKDIKRLNTITERFSKIGSESLLKEENLVEIVQETADYLKTRISDKISFSFDVPESANVKVNKALFEWVIENVTKNAVDAMESNGSITYSISSSDNKVYLDISDTGKGIPASKHKTIFEPGYTTKKRGWGLGLSLVKRIVEEYHKGKILVKSSSPSGTTFRISLPK